MRPPGPHPSVLTLWTAHQGRLSCQHGRKQKKLRRRSRSLLRDWQVIVSCYSLESMCFYYGKIRLIILSLGRLPKGKNKRTRDEWHFEYHGLWKSHYQLSETECTLLPNFLSDTTWFSGSRYYLHHKAFQWLRKDTVLSAAAAGPPSS